MKQFVIKGAEDATVEDVATPEPAAGQVRLRVRYVGICGSDLHFYEGDYPLGAPVALGHEAVGTIVEVGPDVGTFAVGWLMPRLPLLARQEHGTGQGEELRLRLQTLTGIDQHPQRLAQRCFRIFSLHLGWQLAPAHI